MGLTTFFYSKEDFDYKLKIGNFLEHALVFDNYYGTPKDFVKNFKSWV